MKVASQYAGFGRKEASTAEDWMAEQYLAAKRAEKKMAEQYLTSKRAEKKMAEQQLASKRWEEKMAEQHLASKRLEEKMAEQRLPAKRPEENINGELFVDKRPKHQMAVAEAAAAEETKPARKTKLVRVKQEYIDLLLSRPPPRPFTGLSDERIDKVPSAALRAQMRVLYRQVGDRMRSLRAKDADILEQYRTKGYAEEEVEIPEKEAVAN